MGQNNRTRRAAKTRARARRHLRRREARPRSSTPERARQLLWAAASTRQAGDPLEYRYRTELASMPARLCDGEAERMLLDCVDRAWAGGWQPAELYRQSRLKCASAGTARLAGLTIAADHANRRSTTLDARWTAQVEALGLPRADGRPGWLAQWVGREQLDRHGAIEGAIDAIATIGWLPRLEVLLPPPGSKDMTFGDGRAPRVESDALLGRIRNLLAKAESTTFEAEATALTAKAQELMTRHAIDAAMVQTGSRSIDDRPITIRVPIDAPYVDVKSLLLQTVAEAGRCRAVLHVGLAMSSVVGFPDDVAVVELMFTSLLVQAQTALTDAARRAPAGTRTRSQSYRSAFLLGFTDRIGDRLREINDAVHADVEAERGPSFLPALRSRADDVDDLMAEQYGDTITSRVRGGYDSAGWAGGAVAADNANLANGDLMSH